MTPGAELLEWLGPRVCEDCKTGGSTLWGGKYHPICKAHLLRLFVMFEEHPERVVEWEGDGEYRKYVWVDSVQESRDSDTVPGDLDQGGFNKSIRTIWDYNIPWQGLLKLSRLRALYHRRPRDVTFDPEWRIV